MPLRDVLGFIAKNPLLKACYKVFSITDLHSCILWYVIKEYIDKNIKEMSTLDVVKIK